MIIASKNWVISLLNKLFKKTLVNQQENAYKNISFQFAIDDDGNYGYIKDGADTVTPFKTTNLTDSTLLVYTDTYQNETLKVYDSTENLVGSSVFSSDGIAQFILPKGGGNYWFIVGELNTVYTIPYLYLGASSVCNILYKSNSTVFNNLTKIHQFIGKNAASSVCTITNSVITLSAGSDSTYAIWTGAVVYFDKVDLTNMSYIKITVYRNDTDGRMYLLCSNIELSSITDKFNSSEGHQSTHSWGIESYVSDATAKATYSINVTSLTGYYYVAFSNNADAAITYITNVTLS